MINHPPLNPAANLAMTADGWRRDAPSWEEKGHAVEVVMQDGRVVQGRLAITDYMFDGEHEWPIWSIETAEGGRVSFDDHERWRAISLQSSAT